MSGSVRYSSGTRGPVAGRRRHDEGEQLVGRPVEEELQQAVLIDRACGGHRLGALAALAEAFGPQLGKPAREQPQPVAIRHHDHGVEAVVAGQRKNHRRAERRRRFGRRLGASRASSTSPAPCLSATTSSPMSSPGSTPTLDSTE
jgi:hypothetical protein